jgi:hypothetical protein
VIKMRRQSRLPELVRRPDDRFPNLPFTLDCIPFGDPATCSTRWQDHEIYPACCKMARMQEMRGEQPYEADQHRQSVL